MSFDQTLCIVCDYIKTAGDINSKLCNIERAENWFFLSHSVRAVERIYVNGRRHLECRSTLKIYTEEVGHPKINVKQ